MEHDEAAAILEVEELSYGKPVRSPDGPVTADAEYGVTSRSRDLPSPLALLPERLIDDTALAPAAIDKAFAQRGALVFVAVQDGLAAMRLRFRAEAGEGAQGRQFVLATTLLLRDAWLWRDVPPGFFAWCEEHLEAIPHVQGEPVILPSRQMFLPAWEHRSADWLDGLEEWRQIQLGSAFNAITSRREWLAAHPPAGVAEPRPGAMLAADLDVIASLQLDTPLANGDGHGFVFSMGIDPALTPGAVAYLPARRGGALEAADFGALRKLIGDSGTRARAGQPLPRVELFDSLGRSIGREPIPLPFF